LNGPARWRGRAVVIAASRHQRQDDHQKSYSSHRDFSIEKARRLAVLPPGS
jgi:hypothetical protein